MPRPRAKQHRKPKQRRPKRSAKWKKKITAEAGRKLRAKSKQIPPDTSSIPWL